VKAARPGGRTDIVTVQVMELIELDTITVQQWQEIIAGEHQPWGGLAEGLVWAEKQRCVGLRTAAGRLVAVGGAMLVEIDIEGAEHFQVVGIGSVFVMRRERGRGLVWKLLAALLEIATGMGPDRAMLFCRAQLAALYARRAFVEIPAPVWARQPDGAIEMPLRAMWRPLRERAVDWPEGRVEVGGLPF
jgi:predicted GNAT family N-acyltransferase